MSIPVLDLPWQYQHEYQLKQYLYTRDKYTAADSRAWSTTAVEFAAAVHLLPSKCAKSYWHAARRSLILYDWMGHGRNRAKRSTATAPLVGPVNANCPFCNEVDDQQHIMLDCTRPELIPIRKTAMEHQHQVATALKLRYPVPTIRYFIEQLVYASWSRPSLHTRRIWLGMWNSSTLQTLLHPSINLTSPLTLTERYTYRNIVRDLTTPLVAAYRSMIQLQLCDPPPNVPPNCGPLSIKTTRQVRLLFHHSTYETVMPCLPLPHRHHNTSLYTYFGTAFSLTDADVRPHYLL